VVRPGTLAEENSLFQNAVDARNQGDDRGEAEHLAALLSRYPGSQLAGEARLERMRALQRTGRAAEASREARRYLAEFPDGFAREEARRIVMQDGASGRSAP
jgi:outer membrane protein assembly factor BamD (BamD/ComL family)